MIHPRILRLERVWPSHRELITIDRAAIVTATPQIPLDTALTVLYAHDKKMDEHDWVTHHLFVPRTALALARLPQGFSVPVDGTVVMDQGSTDAGTVSGTDAGPDPIRWPHIAPDHDPVVLREIGQKRNQKLFNPRDRLWDPLEYAHDRTGDHAETSLYTWGVVVGIIQTLGAINGTHTHALALTLAVEAALDARRGSARRPSNTLTRISIHPLQSYGLLHTARPFWDTTARPSPGFAPWAKQFPPQARAMGQALAPILAGATRAQAGLAIQVACQRANIYGHDVIYGASAHDTAAAHHLLAQTQACAQAFFAP